MVKKWTILLVEPSQRTRTLLEQVLLKEEIHVICAATCETGLLAFKKNNIQLVVTEARLPDSRDFELITKIQALSSVPVLVLSELSHESQRIHGFELGVADYVTKPFSPREVWLRISRLLTYFYQPFPFKQSGTSYVYPFMTVDVTERNILVEQKRVKLTPTEFKLLVYLLQRPKKVISRSELLTEVWGYEYLGEERTVDVHIRKLRNQLKPYSLTAAQSIKTERGRGYYFDPVVPQQVF